MARKTALIQPETVEEIKRIRCESLVFAAKFLTQEGADKFRLAVHSGKAERTHGLGKVKVAVKLTPKAEAALVRLRERLGVSDREALEMAFAVWADSKFSPRKARGVEGGVGTGAPIILQNRRHIVAYSKALIFALEEVVDYDPKRHHNLPPPALLIEDDEYLSEIRELILELRRLNDLLSAKHPSSKQAIASAVCIGKHVNTFLDRYAKSLGTGAGIVTIALIASLLHQAGLGETIVQSILHHFQLK